MSDYVRALRAKIGNDLLLAPSVNAAIRDGDGRLLLVFHRVMQYWVLPGGMVEPEERPANSVVRETLEETGLTVVPVRITGVYGGPELSLVYPNGHCMSFVMTVYECRITGGSLAEQTDEAARLGFFTRDGASVLPLAPWMQMVLDDLFSGDKINAQQAPSPGFGRNGAGDGRNAHK